MDLGTAQEFSNYAIDDDDVAELERFREARSLPDCSSLKLLGYGLISRDFGASFSDGGSVGGGGCHITMKGDQYLAYRQGKKDGEAAASRRSFVRKVIEAAVIAIVTLLIEHILDVVAFICSLFQ